MNEHDVSSIAPAVIGWQEKFLEMLPEIEQHTRRAFRRLDSDAREEAMQSVVTSAAMAYATLAASAKTEQCHASTLARYGVMQYRSGRLPGGSVNSNDVGSVRCRVRGCRVEPIDQWKESLCDSRRATPADVAALRVDFSDWYDALAPRDRHVVNALANGERPSCVARLCQLTAGRVSQLRRELYDSWREFTGDSLAMVQS